MRTMKLKKEYNKLAYEVYGFKKQCEKCGKNEGKICIHHKDENYLNNSKENLQILCNSCHISHHKKGNTYLRGKKLSQETKRKMSINQWKIVKVNQYDLQGNFIKTWNSMTTIVKQIKISQGNISSCCKGDRKTAGGFIWKYFNN